MSFIGYAAIKRFVPQSEGWQKFVEWAQLPQITRVMSLDYWCELPKAAQQMTDEDWKHVVPSEFAAQFSYFDNADYLIERMKGVAECDIVGVVEEPDSPFPHGFKDDRFEFKGYDLFDGLVSVLTNCGGYPDCFCNDELNEFGLLPTWERAVEVQTKLQELYPDDHADCAAVWAMWLMRTEAS